jgi:hypothetical protein
MRKTQFNRDEMAKRYANQHLKTDPGIQVVYYLPEDAPEREIRLLEINNMISDREKDALEPIDFGVEIGSATAHTLMVLDITPRQWRKIKSKERQLPEGWSLHGATRFSRSKA